MITCTDSDTILAVADGSISDEHIISDVLKHIAYCKQCRTLYEDYFLVYGNEDKEVYQANAM